MKIPDKWFLADTGPGCTDLVKDIPNTGLEWYITAVGDPSAPTNPDHPCCLGLYVEGSVMLQWRCSCQAEALAIADGATPCT